MIAMLLAAATAIPDADPLPLPSPVWLLRVLLLLTFFLHVLAMNFVLGGSLIAAVARVMGSENAMRLAKAFGKAMPTCVATAITLGVAPLLFLQTLYGRLFFASSVLMAWYWLAIVPVLIVAYYGTYRMAFKKNDAPGGSRFAFLAVVVALLLAAISLAQSTNMTMMLRPDQFLPKYLESARGVQLNTGDPTFLPRWLHMFLGAIAVGGFSVSMYGVGKAKREEDHAHGVWAMRWGALWFVAPTALNLITGLWWIGVLPREVILRFMGRDLHASVSLAIGIVLGFVTLGMMLMAVGTAEPAKLIKRSGWTLFVTLGAMILARDSVRKGMLSEAKFVPTSWIEPQWGPILIFVVLLVGGLATTAWMVMVLMKAKPAD